MRDDLWAITTAELNALHYHSDNLIKVLNDVLCYYDDAKDDCGICGNGTFSGHKPGCIIPDIQKVLKSSQGEK